MNCFNSDAISSENPDGLSANLSSARCTLVYVLTRSKSVHPFHRQRPRKHVFDLCQLHRWSVSFRSFLPSVGLFLCWQSLMHLPKADLIRKAVSDKCFLLLSPCTGLCDCNHLLLEYVPYVCHPRLEWLVGSPGFTYERKVFHLEHSWRTNDCSRVEVCQEANTHHPGVPSLARS